MVNSKNEINHQQDTDTTQSTITVTDGEHDFMDQYPTPTLYPTTGKNEMITQFRWNCSNQSEMLAAGWQYCTDSFGKNKHDYEGDYESDKDTDDKTDDNGWSLQQQLPQQQLR